MNMLLMQHMASVAGDKSAWNQPAGAKKGVMHCTGSVAGKRNASQRHGQQDRSLWTGDLEELRARARLSVRHRPAHALLPVGQLLPEQRTSMMSDHG